MEYNFSDKNVFSGIEDWEDFDFQWRKHFQEEMEKVSNLPKGLCVGKIIAMPVADGYAYYQVVKVNKTTARIKWRPDLCLDHYRDNVLGEGGSFPRHIIEKLIIRKERLDEIFGINK